MKKKGLLLTTLLCLFIFADFLAPYSAEQHKENYTAYPPMRIHFWHENKWLGPFIYNRDQKPVRLKFLTRGAAYKILGIIPSNRHLFGTDSDTVALLGTDYFGRDIFSRLILGGRISLSIAAAASALCVFISFYLGIISAIYSGFVDKAVQFIAESIKTIPRILLILLLSRLIPMEVSLSLRALGIILILAASGWMYWEKIIRTVVYQEQQKEFILCAWASGANKNNIMRMHMRPLLKDYFQAAFMNTLPLMLMNEAMLSFLGVGIQDPSASWGLMLNQLDSASNLIQMPWLISSGLALICTVMYLHQAGKNLKTQRTS